MLFDTYLRERPRDIWKHGELTSCSNNIAEGLLFSNTSDVLRGIATIFINAQWEGCTANKVKLIPPVLPLSVQDSRIRSGLIMTKFVFASLTIYR